MSPILGIYASQISGHLWEPAGAYDALWSTTLSATTSTVTISNIPQTYKHLQLRILARTNRALESDFLSTQFNSDTTSANYRSHTLTGTGATVTASDGTNTSGVPSRPVTAATAGTNIFGVLIIDILDYSNTSKYKTTRNLGGYDNNGSGTINLQSGLWMSTSAINTINLLAQGGSSSFVQYSSIALYGVN